VCPNQPKLPARKASFSIIALRFQPPASFTDTPFDSNATFPGLSPAARGEPIPIGSVERLPTSSCIGNAPAFYSNTLPCFTAPSHSRYKPNDFLSIILPI